LATRSASGGAIKDLLAGLGTHQYSFAARRH
jgi:hypothetical protein